VDDNNETDDEIDNPENENEGTDNDNDNDDDNDDDNDNDTDNDEDNDDDDDDNDDDEEHAKIAGVRGNLAGVTEEKEEDFEQKMNTRYGTRTEEHNLRPRKPRDYGHIHTTLEHTCMTQHSVNKGLKVFGESGSEAVVAEMQQLHDRDVIEPKKSSMLTREEKHKALHYLMFLKKKRCGRIKARGCADGRKQRIYKTKEETSAPTVAIESLMLSCTIDAKEKRKVVTADIPGAFMQADMDEVIHMKLEGPLAELLTKVNPAKYEKFIEIEKGKPVMYVLLKKALYGTLQAALLFWQDLSGNLEEWGYTVNPYDTCVMNKMVNGKQCTILWHVDDLKISHVDQDVIEEVLDLLDKKYGKEAPLTVTRGHVHEYLGMTVDYSEEGKVAIIMEPFIEAMLDDLPADMDGEASSPAANHLFEVNADAEQLDEATSQMFHTNTAKLLFLSRRARPDIQTAVAFLTTRVKAPDVDDYKKLARCMKYLRATITLHLTLEGDDLRVVKWWVDGSFAIHPDMKSHTGATMMMGKGSIYSTSIRQKLNTKSSTEAELVAVDDVMPQILWTQYFLKAQGYDVETATIYQDNQSAMLLEKNGKGSSGKRTRHVNIRYYFVTDRIKSKEVQVEYCPTGIMRGDFFTKPLQGTPFRTFRDQILNVKT